MAVTTDLHLEVDWNGDADFGDTYDDITDLAWNIQTFTGRDHASSLTGKAGAGRLTARLNNFDDRFSPFNNDSVLTVTPSYVAVGTAGTGNGAVPTTHTLPAGVALGDYMICTLYTREATDAVVSISSGWREIYNERSSGGLLAVWGRAYQTGDAVPTFTATGLAVGDDVIAQIAAWSDVNLARPIGVKGTISSNGSAQDIGAISGITLQSKGMLVVIGGKADDWTSVATLSQTGMTFAEIAEPDTTTGNDAGLVWDYATVDAGTSLAVTNKTFAVTGGGSAVGKGVMFSLNGATQVLPGKLVRLRDETDVLWIGKVQRIVPDVGQGGLHSATLEAAGIFAEAANMETLPITTGTGDATGTLIAGALDDAGLDDTLIDTGDVTTGPFGATTAKVRLLDDIRKLEETERGFLYEDQEEYRFIFKDASDRASITSPSAVFSDDPNETLHYEQIRQEDWVGHIFNRCIAGVSPYTLAPEEATLVTLPGPYSMDPGESTNLIAQYSANPLVTFTGHFRDIYYGSNVPTYQSTTSAGSVSTSATHSFSLPATITADDLLLMFLLTTLDITAGPSGFTEIFSVSISATCYLHIYAKKAIGTEDGASVSITLSSATNAHYAARILRFTGWHGDVTQIDVSTQATGTGTTVDAPSLTPDFGALAAYFLAFYVHETTSGGDPTAPSGYTATTTAGTNGTANFLNIARRAESTGVSSENPAAWGSLFTSETWYAYTLGIRGARSVQADVSGTTPDTAGGDFTISYDGSVGGGVGTQDHENIRVTGTYLETNDGAFAQADYLPSQATVGLRSYRNPSNLFATVEDAQEYADEVVKDFGEPRPVMSMTYTANKNADLYAAAIALKVNNRITLEANNNAGLGVSEDFFIESIARAITPGQLHRVTYALSPASVSDT